MANQDKTLPERLWDQTTVNDRVPTDGFIGSRLMMVDLGDRYFVDNPAVQIGDGGVGADSFMLGQQGLCLAADDRFQTVALRRLTIRTEAPAGAGESALIRFWKYHKGSPTTGYYYQQCTDSFVYDDSQPWSWPIDFSGNIRPITFDRRTDALVFTAHYTEGVGSMRALQVDWEAEAVEPGSGDPIVMAAGRSAVQAWPPS